MACRSSAGSSPTSPSSGNNPPTSGPAISAIVVLPIEAGLAEVTSYSFQGSGIQGSNLSYAWDFGDGSRASTSSANHVFRSAGSFQVRLTLSNSAGNATTTTQVAVKNLTGRWRVVQDGGLGSRGNVDLIQTGAQLAGRYFDDIGDVPNAVIEASEITGRRVAFRALQDYGNRSTLFRFEGNLNSTADKICGTLNFITGFVMTRTGSATAGDFTNNCNR